MSLPRAPVLIACACLLSGALAARAEPVATAPLSLREAITAALRDNPELRGFAYELKVQDGRVAQAALAPAPELGFTAENFAGTGAVRGFTATEFTLTLSQLVELGDKRARRIDVADAGRGLIEAEQATRQLDLLADVVRQFIAVAADQERRGLAQRAVQLAEETQRAVESRVKAARSPLAEGSRARIALARAQLAAAQTEHSLVADRRQLAALWGDDAPRFETVAADLYTLPPTDSFEALAVRLERNPDLARYLSEARLRDAEVHLAIAARTPDVQFGAGIRRLQVGSDEALVFSAAVPLNFGARRNQGAIAEAQARRERVDLDRSAARLRVRTALFGLYQQLLQARATSEGLVNDILPQAEAALKETEYAWQRGRYSYLEWVDAQRELLGLRQQRVDAAAEYHRLLAEIERLTGEPLARQP